MFKTIRKWWLWRKIRAGKDCVGIKKGCGYYIPTGIIGVKNIGRIEEWPMKSGKTAIVKLIDYSCFSDPDDMIKESTWELLGYVGEPRISDMPFSEFKELIK